MADLDITTSYLQRRRRVRALTVLLAALIVLSIILDHFGAFGHAGNDWQTFDRHQVRVDRVIDGDTVEIPAGTGFDRIRVRLIGIDAPELHSDGSAKPDYWADRAKRYLAARAEDRTVTHRLDGTQTRDRYGRLLAYLYASDTDNVNLDLVRDGQAYADRRFPHSLSDSFEQAENMAHGRQAGLWENVRPEQMPQWRQRWLSEEVGRR
jgi:endonuclease YncB( thermonuclease family)